MTTRIIASLRVRNHREIAHNPMRAMARMQAADRGLLKVMQLLSRTTNVHGGAVGFTLAYIKRERLPLTHHTIAAARQVCDSVLVLAE